MSSEDINSMNRYLIDTVAEQATKIGELEREIRDLREQLQRLALVKDKNMLQFYNKCHFYPLKRIAARLYSPGLRIK